MYTNFNWQWITGLRMMGPLAPQPTMGFFCKMPWCKVHESGLGQNRRDYWPVCASFWLSVFGFKDSIPDLGRAQTRPYCKTCGKLAFLKSKLGTFHEDSPAEGHDTPTSVGNRNRGCSPPSIKKYKCQMLLCITSVNEPGSYWGLCIFLLNRIFMKVSWIACLLCSCRDVT